MELALTVATTSLNFEPSERLRRKIVSRFWRKPEEAIRPEEYKHYFDYYISICRTLYLGVIHSESSSIVFKTHEDVLDMVDIIRSLYHQGSNFTRPQLRALLDRDPKFANQPASVINHSINLALRLWLTIQVQDAEFAGSSRTVQWDDTVVFEEFVSRCFPGPRPSGLDNPWTILETNFTAANLRRLCGIRVEWVYILEDHLRFDVQRRVLMLFSLTGFLGDNLNTSVFSDRIIQFMRSLNRSPTPLPSALIKETFLSLAILFPNWGDSRTKKYLQHTDHINISNHSVKCPSHAHLSEFHYWRDRLARIHHEFQTPGPGWRHLWSDRRNPLQWYTFWFAVAIFIMTFVFGILTVVLTGLQTWYSYQSLQLARAQTA